MKFISPFFFSVWLPESLQPHHHRTCFSRQHWSGQKTVTVFCVNSFGGAPIHHSPEQKERATWLCCPLREHCPDLPAAVYRGKRTFVVCENLRSQRGFPETPVNRRTYHFSLSLSALHQWDLPASCALRIVPASSAFHRCSFPKEPETVLREPWKKGGIGPGIFFPRKCGIYWGSCTASVPWAGCTLAASVLWTGKRHLPGVICISGWIFFFELPKPTAYKNTSH